MFVLHIALQGCLKGSEIDYGLTADTGGHIRYLLELAEASEASPGIDRIEIATRAFVDAELGPDYEVPRERVSDTTTILRFATDRAGYCSKEDMHRETPAFIRALGDYIDGLERRPDMVHAHYADAGAVAAALKERFGIPFLFTAHSLGRVKRKAMAGPGGASPDDSLDRRIAIEEAAIAAADAIIASSRDEAERQYADYEAYEPGKIRVIAPGAVLGRYADAICKETVTRSIDRFLAHPERPVVLAISRPVRKKNLKSLVIAYGEDAALRERANLVIVGGVRDELDEMEPECREVWEELFALIDRYDLYGQIAYPKNHLPDDVPSIYALARARGGIFVNPALNEPFGLTLLEASATGLPLVATDSGGPNDIVEQCGNGILVPPRETGQLADAMIALLTDSDRWAEYAANGREAVEAYSWDRHVAITVRLIEELTGAEPAALPAEPTTMLVCDIDNTLLGDSRSLGAFCDWHAGEDGVLFGIATGRSFHSAQSILAREGAPHPAFIIGSVGTEIYRYDSAARRYRFDTDWERRIAAGWRRDAIRDLIAEQGDLRRQGPLEQHRLKLSYFIDDQRDAAAAITDLLSRHGFNAQVIGSHGRYLDILPAGASKGSAVAYMRETLGLAEDAVIVAGDSGNDVEMLASSPKAIIVGNCSDGLDRLPQLRHGYRAKATHAAGILEGIAHFQGSRAA